MELQMPDDNVIDLSQRFNRKEKSQKKSNKKSKKDREQIVKEASSWGVNASRAVFDSWMDEGDLDQVALLFFLTNFIDDLMYTGCPASNIQMCLAKGFETHEDRDSDDPKPITN